MLCTISGVFVLVRPVDDQQFPRLWEDDWRKGGEDPEWNDQEAFRRLHKEYYPKYSCVYSVNNVQYLFPRFKVDSLARVWTRCDSGIDCI